jgi:hypothetical protein
MGFLGIARGFLLKNPVRQSFTQYGLRAVTGDFGGLFQLLENILKLNIYTDWYQSGSSGKINFSDREKP